MRRDARYSAAIAGCSAGASNWAVSVESARAVVEDRPPPMASATASKYPVPTSCWWRVAEYRLACAANSAS